MVTITGKITRGLGAATETLRNQWPHFLNVCPELAACHRATINVILDSQLEVISPDFVIGPIVWSPDPSGELFGLQRIRFELIEPSSEVQAWLYIPYKSPHRLNPYYIEVIAPKLTIQKSPACRVHVTSAKVIATRT